MNPMDKKFFYNYFMHFCKESDLTNAYILIAREITNLYTHDKQEMGRILLLMDETYDEFMKRNFSPVH